MIASLTGSIQIKTPQNIILDVNGVGYLIWVNLNTISKIGNVGDKLTIITHLEVKEESLTLFGFLDNQAYLLFKLLTSVSGVGAKSGLNILDLGNASDIANAIRDANLAVLTSVSGIGKKTAERIVLELKDKVLGFSSSSSSSMSMKQSSEDLETALESLGYKPNQIQRVMQEIDFSKDLGEQVRIALKLLQK